MSLVASSTSSSDLSHVFPLRDLVSLPEQLHNIRSCLSSGNAGVGQYQKDEGVPEMAFKGLDGLSVELFMAYGENTFLY